MSDILESRRTSIMLPDFGMKGRLERPNFVFYIECIEGLPVRPGWTPKAGATVSIEGVVDDETNKPLHTDPRKIVPGKTIWSQNLKRFQATKNTPVRFDVEYEPLFSKRTVLGSTEQFTIDELLQMQKRGVDNSVKLDVTLTQAAIRPPLSPKSPRSSFAGIRSSAPSSAKTFLEVPSSPPLDAASSPPSAGLPVTPGSPKMAALYVSIRETPVDPNTNSHIHASDIKAFAEENRKESLDRLIELNERITFVRTVFEEDTHDIALVDIVLGALEASRKLFSEPDSMTASRHIDYMLRQAIIPYESLSQRRPAKHGKGTEKALTIEFLQEMLISLVHALSSANAVLHAIDIVRKNYLDDKVDAWGSYFKQCKKYLDGQSEQKPKHPPPSIGTSPRLASPKVLAANPKFPTYNMLQMRLPDVVGTDTYNRPDLVRLLAEWIFTTTTTRRAPPPRNSSITVELPTVPVSPSPVSPAGSPRQMKRPVALSLNPEEDNFLGPKDLKGVLSASEESPLPRKEAESQTLDNVFCLSGATGSGKTLLAAKLCNWLGQMKCLGGYFSFEHDDSRRNISYREILNALPMTLIHQTSIVDPAAAAGMIRAISLKANVIDETLERRFEVLFANPIIEYVAGRSKRESLDAMVFVIDLAELGSGMSIQVGENGDNAEDETTVQMFVSWISSEAVRDLPVHIKLLVLTRHNTSVEKILKERGARGCDMVPIIRYVEEAGSSGSQGEGGWSTDVNSTSLKAQL